MGLHSTRYLLSLGSSNTHRGLFSDDAFLTPLSDYWDNPEVYCFVRNVWNDLKSRISIGTLTTSAKPSQPL